MKRPCLHRKLDVRTEPDGCSWVVCSCCGFRGPKKHAYGMALVAWVVKLSSDHPHRRARR
jgi:hypothetical protein